MEREAKKDGLRKLIIWWAISIPLFIITYLTLYFFPGFPFYGPPNDMFWTIVIGGQVLNISYGWLVVLVVMLREKGLM